MKIKFAFKGVFLGVPEPKRYDNGMSYSVSVMCDGDVGSLKCDENVYGMCVEGAYPFGADCKFNAIYNSDYRSVKIDRIIMVDKQ